MQFFNARILLQLVGLASVKDWLPQLPLRNTALRHTLTERASQPAMGVSKGVANSVCFLLAVAPQLQLPRHILIVSGLKPAMGRRVLFYQSVDLISHLLESSQLMRRNWHSGIGSGDRSHISQATHDLRWINPAWYGAG